MKKVICKTFKFEKFGIEPMTFHGEWQAGKNRSKCDMRLCLLLDRFTIVCIRHGHEEKGYVFSGLYHYNK